MSSLNSVPSDESSPSVDGGGTQRTARATKSSRSRTLQRWFTITHVYISMICLLIVLFFALSGITLNHPTWTLGDEISTSEVSGTLPETSVVDGEVDWFTVAEFVRAEHSLKGVAGDESDDGEEGSITFKGPGYSADVFFTLADRQYDITVEQQGWVGVMNDLHKGRDSSTTWRWVIDLSGVFLALISLTGIGLQFFLMRRRRSAYVTAAAGCVILVLFMWMATR